MVTTTNGHYSRLIPVADLMKHLNRTKQRLGTEAFSVVYKWYSREDGNVRYVGRADNPRGRFYAYTAGNGRYGIDDRLNGQLVWVQYKWFRLKSRINEAYREECRQWHRHQPNLNTNHPAKPKNRKFLKCPWTSCGK